MLLLFALFGLLFPNGLFIYWLFFEYQSIGEIINNHLAVAFIIDAFLAVAMLAYINAKVRSENINGIGLLSILLSVVWDLASRSITG